MRWLLWLIAPEVAGDLSGGFLKYPNGSVPYGDGKESSALRAKRMRCAAKNHHPRSYNGSWCFGYGYVCSRCYMYADPWPAKVLEQRIAQANRLEAEGKDFYLGDVCR